MPSEVWNYFEKTEVTENNAVKRKAKCKKCSKLFTRNDGSTTGLIEHIKRCWKIELKKKQTDKVTETVKLAVTKTLEEKISWLVAVDGISMHCVATSETLRELFAKFNENLPKSPTTVLTLIKKFYDDAKTATIEELKIKIQNKEKFSITMDEWSSITRKRYLNINLHNQKPHNLGLVRIRGSCNCARLKALVAAHLLSFGVDLDHDVVGGTTDGCNFMMKFGKDCSFEHWVCANHTNHLGVCDFIYSKETAETDEAASSDEDDDDFDDFDAIDPTLSGLELLRESSIEIPFENTDFYSNLKDVRTVVKYFRSSDVRNSVLQKNIKIEKGLELELILDVKTRWNTIYSMIKRFLECENAIRKTLKELDNEEIINNINVKNLEELSEALEPVVTVTSRLEKSNATILTAETALEKLCLKLEELDTDVSKKLGKAVKSRYEARRNKPLISLARYLQDPKFLTKNQYFSYSTKTSIVAHAKQLMKRLYPEEYEESDDEDEIPAKKSKISFAEDLDDTLAAEREVQKPKARYSFASELKMFETNRLRTKNITNLFNAVLTIQATSSESERAFSISSKFCTKIRSRLSDESLHILVFLKYYLKRRD
jgi:hypothetical protein